MAGKNTAVFGLYRDEVQLNEGVEALRAAGYRNTDVSVLFPNNQGTKDFSHEKHTKVPEGTALGASFGMLIGAPLGALVNIGALTIPGVDPLTATVPVIAALAGAGALGAVGGLLGAALGVLFPEYEAKRYRGRKRMAGLLMSVHCDSSEWVRKTKEILKNTGAEGIASASEKAADFAKSDKPIERHHKGPLYE